MGLWERREGGEGRVKRAVYQHPVYSFYADRPASIRSAGASPIYLKLTFDAVEVLFGGLVKEERVALVERVDLAFRGDLDVWVGKDELADALIAAVEEDWEDRIET